MSYQPHIPAVYRVWHLYAEPFAALQGAVLAARSPLLYLSVMSPQANLSHYQADVHQIVFDQLAATYFLFAFNQAVVLRIAGGNLPVWRAMVAGMLICDVLHLLGTARALGGWDGLLDVAGWRLFDWANVVLLLVPVAIRTAFLAGVGVKEGTADLKTRSKTKTG